MKKYLSILGAGAIMVAGFSTPGVASRFAQSETITQDCADPIEGSAGTITYNGPTSLWPPNHKHVPATITWTEEDPEDNLSVVFTAGHDQIIDGEELNGSGNTDNDITPALGMPSGTGEIVQEFLIRGERSGRVKEGRTYTISGTAMWTDSDMDASSSPLGSSCDFSFTIHVPHDQGQGGGKL